MSSKKKSANKQQQKQQQSKETKKQCSGGFPVKILFFITFVVLGGAVYSDVQTNGSWKDSHTAYLMKKYHVCEYSHKVLNKTSESIKWVNFEIDKQFPGYEKKLHETLEPYSEMLSDVAIISYNMACNAKGAIVDGFGVIADKIEKQAPGLLEQTREAIKSSLSTVAAYIKKGVNYLKDEVFVGNMSPENMGNVILQALNAIQQKVNEFYVWAYERIRTVIK